MLSGDGAVLLAAATGAALLLFFAALAVALRALAAARRAAADAAALRRELGALRARLDAAGAPARATQPSAPPPARTSGAPRPASTPPPAGAPAPPLREADAAWTGAAEPLPPDGPPAGKVSRPPPRASDAPAALVGAARLSQTEAAASLEERIGVTWFTRVGAAVLTLGAALAFKTAVDNRWLGPGGRVAVGLGAGAALIALAERLRDSTRRPYVHALLGTGLALLAVATYAACGFYQLVSPAAAFAALVVVAAAGGAFSVRHRSESTLVIALAAALANPVLLAPGPDRAATVLGYVFAVTTAAAVVALRLRFAYALWVAGAGAATLGTVWRTGGIGAGGAAPAGDPGVPLAFTAAVVLVWAAAALWADREAFAAARPRWMVRAALAFAHLAAAAVLWDASALAVALAMVACAAAAVALAGAAGYAGALGAATLGLGALLLRGAPPPGARAGWLLAAVAWAAALLFGAARGLRAGAAAGGDPAARASRRAELGAALGLALAGPVGFTALAVRATGAHEPLARAGAATGSAAVLLAAAALLRARRAGASAAARAAAATFVAPMVLAAAALLVAAAVLALDAAAITLAWSALALALALAAARWEAPRLGAWALGLFALAVGRVLVVDGWEGARLAAQFRESLGAAGTLHPPGLLGARTVATLGAAAALFAAGRTARAGLGARGAAGVVAAGHALAALWLVLLARDLATDAPALPRPAEAPAGPASAAFHEAVARYEAAVDAQAGRRAAAATLALGAYGAALLAGGFARRSALHRWLGLGAIGLTVLKLAAWDIWMLPRPFRVVVLIAVGALLLGAGFLYARFGGRLIVLLRDGAPDADGGEGGAPATSAAREGESAARQGEAGAGRDA